MLLSLHILANLLLAVIKLVCLLVAIAYFTLAERKIMAAVQRRVGPNVVGLIGLLQPLADGLKLAGKEAVVPSQASGRLFMAAAMAVLLFALSGWSTIPFGLFDHSETMSTEALVSSLLEYDEYCRNKWYFPDLLDAEFFETLLSNVKDYYDRLPRGETTLLIPPKEGY
jgi:NADH:ubiquinone oxidoreductase subunit H